MRMGDDDVREVLSLVNSRLKQRWRYLSTPSPTRWKNGIHLRTKRMGGGGGDGIQSDISIKCWKTDNKWTLMETMRQNH